MYGVAVLLGTAVVSSNAYAADLGGDCCADLEERVAELEATTARKGNRKVSLTVYGQVTSAVMWWESDDDAPGAAGDESNVYVVDPQTSGTRFGFKGKAKITSDWSAGYRIELQYQQADADAIRKDNDEGPNLPEFRLANWYIKSKTLGKITVGQGNTANSGIAEINVANSNIADGMSSSHAGDEIIERTLDGPDLENFEFNRRNVVRYDTPTVAGFILSASYGEDDLWDVALRYAGELGGFKIAAGIAYGEVTDGTVSLGDGAFRNSNGNGGIQESAIQTLNGGLSVKHVGTGLFATGSAGTRDADGNVSCGAALCEEESFWFVNAGIEQKWSSLGKTTLFGMGGEYEDAISRSAQHWGLGAVQKIDAAAMDMFISYRHYDIDPSPGTNTEPTFDTVVGGARIKF